MIFFAIPFFNKAEYLHETLISLIRQTCPHWNAAVFDDASEPQQSQLAANHVKRLGDARIQYKKNATNLGMAKNWNQGLLAGINHPTAIATTILHADDRLLEDYVLAMSNALRGNPQITAVFCKTVIIDNKGQRSFSFADFYKKTLISTNSDKEVILNGVDGIAKLIPGNFIFCPTLCYRNFELLERFDEQFKMVLDLEFILRLLKKGNQLLGLYAQPLFEYRRHAANATNVLTQNLQRFYEEEALYSELANWLLGHGYITLSKEAAKMTVIKKNLIFLFFQAIVTGRLKLAYKYINHLLRMNELHNEFLK